MKIVGLTRQGCWAMLISSLLVLLLADMALYHSLAPQTETIPFMALIALCVGRRLWADSK